MGYMTFLFGFVVLGVAIATSEVELLDAAGDGDLTYIYKTLAEKTRSLQKTRLLQKTRPLQQTLKTRGPKIPLRHRAAASEKTGNPTVASDDRLDEEPEVERGFWEATGWSTPFITAKVIFKICFWIYLVKVGISGKKKILKPKVD
ncbi:unnamed protein product [Meganyctiphanes norvegica]|uniref:Uncharacterized protein n=1 Tax=Meganyctiphanes norvegica TaxID=48144 RepID=A0AAV2QIR9_MEGNR